MAFSQNNESASKQSKPSTTSASNPPISPDKKDVIASDNDDDYNDDSVELTPEEEAQMNELALRLKEASRVPSIELDDILDPTHPSNAKYFQKSTRRILQEQDSDETSSDEPTSSEGESDSDDEDEDEDEEMADGSNQPSSSTANPSLPRITAQKKPNIRPIKKDNDILSRLSAFLPKMRDANEDLEREIAAGRGKDLRLDEVDDNDQGRYIEMNLGLGVLEEKRSDDEDDDTSSDEDDQNLESTQEKAQQPKDSNNLNKLMGKKNEDTEKPTIEVLHE